MSRKDDLRQHEFQLREISNKLMAVIRDLPVTLGQEQELDQPERLDRPRKFGPKTHEHPSIGEKCPACKHEFQEGDYTTLISLGPGADREEQARAREGRPYNAIAVEVHWACATGEVE